MTTAQQILDIARAEIGTKENPPNSNRTKYGAFSGYDGQPWCASFVDWVFSQARKTGLIGAALKPFVYCPTGVQWFHEYERWFSAPQVGDLVFFNFSGGALAEHVGLVESWGMNTLGTIEGNTAIGNDANGGEVMRRTRPRNSSILGYGRPAYSQSIPTPPPIGSKHMNNTVVAVLARGDSYYLITDKGTVHPYGNLPFLGDLAKSPPNNPITHASLNEDGTGYVLLSQGDNGVFPFGKAQFHGHLD